MTRTLASLDPATGETVGTVPVTPVEEIPALVERSHVAARAWADTPLEERRDALIDPRRGPFLETCEQRHVVHRRHVREQPGALNRIADPAPKRFHVTGRRRRIKATKNIGCLSGRGR